MELLIGIIITALVILGIYEIYAVVSNDVFAQEWLSELHSVLIASLVIILILAVLFTKMGWSIPI